MNVSRTLTSTIAAAAIASVAGLAYAQATGGATSGGAPASEIKQNPNAGPSTTNTQGTTNTQMPARDSTTPATTSGQRPTDGSAMPPSGRTDGTMAPGAGRSDATMAPGSTRSDGTLMPGERRARVDRN